MKFFKIWFMVLVLVLMGGLAHADTHNAASCSYADVNTALTAASDGDIVHIPAGSCTWSSGIATTKFVTFEGAGNTQTIITNGRTALYTYLISWTFTSNAATNLDFGCNNMTFTGNDAIGVENLSSSATWVTKMQIHDMIFNLTGSDRGIEFDGFIAGVVYKNKMEGSNHWHLHSYGADAASWNLADDWYPGSSYAIVWEDNEMIHHGPGSSRADSFFGGSYGGRYVARYNTFSMDNGSYAAPVFDAHGNQGSGNVAHMGMEAYGNWMIQGSVNLLGDIRGGQAMIYWNLTPSGQPAWSRIREEVWDYYSYIYGDIPVNWNDQHAQKCYGWNNRNGGGTLYVFDQSGGNDCDADIGTQTTPCTDGTHGYSLNVNDEVHDYNPSYNGTTQIGLYCGSSLPARCTTGDGAWITTDSCTSINTNSVGKDATVHPSNNGVMHRCTSTDTWELYYTPLTYPHPLRGATPPVDPPAGGGGAKIGSGCGVKIGSGAGVTIQ